MSALKRGDCEFYQSRKDRSGSPMLLGLVRFLRTAVVHLRSR